MKPLKFEVGKFYRTRNGRKVLIHGIIPDKIFPIKGETLDDCAMYSWRKIGLYNFGDEKSPLDIIGPWRNKPTPKTKRCPSCRGKGRVKR